MLGWVKVFIWIISKLHGGVKLGSELYVDVFTNGIIGPDVRMLGPVADGGKITFLTAPWLLGSNDYANIERWT